MQASGQEANRRTDEEGQAAPRGRHLWEIRAVRELFLLAAIPLVIWLLFVLQPVVVPILIAFVAAYLVDPIVTGLHRRLAIPRLAASVTILIVGGGLLLVLASWSGPHLADQANQLIDRLPEYLSRLSDEYNVDAETLSDDLSTRLRVSPQNVVRGLAAGSARVFGFVGTVVGAAVYAVMAVVLVVVLFVYLSTHFKGLAHIERLVPPGRRDLFWRLVGGVDAAFAGYIRGQLVVAVFTTTGFCIGFWLADVPYWFVVSLIGGVLSLIPYGQCSGWVLAIALKYLEAQAGDESGALSFWSIVMAPTAVYAVTQSCETWLIAPIVQGQVNRMHPVTIIVVLVIGGTLGGVIGLILAIPITASIKVFARELLWPKLERESP